MESPLSVSCIHLPLAEQLGRFCLILAAMKRSTLPITVVPLRPLSLRAASAPGRPRYLSAASGLVCTGGELSVVADDELHLGRFALHGTRPGTLQRLFPGELPASPGRRKQRKPDLEVLLRLAPFEGFRHGALMALGSGTHTRRQAGALLALDRTHRPERRAQAIDASPLFARLVREVGEVNVEGGWVWGDHLFLLQRGNRGKAANAIVAWPSAPILRTMMHEHVMPDIAPVILREMPLGTIDGVPLGFTDGTPLPDGRWLFSAVAEDTRDARRDGRFVGACVGMAGSRQGLHWLRPVMPAWKVEGIEIDPRSRASRLLLVSDADDPDQPAWLLEARLS